MIVGAQLYTVRAYAQSSRDLRLTLRRIADMGYTAVQLSAIGPMDARTVRALCDEAGLKIVLTHTAESRILNEVDEVIREHEILGADFIGLGAMSERYRTAEWADRFAADFTGPARAFRAAGKRFMYHNHAFEFGRLADGRRLMDILLEQMPTELMGVTLDTYWLQYAGCDGVEWIRRLQGRLSCVHLKDMTVSGFENRMAAVGEGNMNFPAILRALEQGGQTQYLLVEQDSCYGASPFDCLKTSYDNLKEMGV